MGKVRVEKCGLYYRFQCCCRINSDLICRLFVHCGDKRENLGIVVPMEGGFVLDTKLPVKRFPEEPMEFCLVPKLDAGAGNFVPVYPEEPFGFISRLKDAYLVRRENGNCICIK